MPRLIRGRRIGPDDDAEVWARALTRARIPERFWGSRLDLVRGVDIAWLQSLLDAPSGWAGKGYGFYIHGDFNTGKSALAAIFMMDLISRCEKALWIPVRDVPLVKFRQSDEAKELDDALRVADIIVIDDLGAERFELTSAAGAALESTVRTMYERERSVIFTSNIQWDGGNRPFAHRYGSIPSLVSVVQRITKPIVLATQWPNSPDSLL